MIAAPASMVPLLTIVTSFSPSSQGWAAGPLVVILPPVSTVSVSAEAGSTPAGPTALLRSRVPFESICPPEDRIAPASVRVAAVFPPRVIDATAVPVESDTVKGVAEVSSPMHTTDAGPGTPADQLPGVAQSSVWAPPVQEVEHDAAREAGAPMTTAKMQMRHAAAAAARLRRGRPPCLMARERPDPSPPPNRTRAV